MHFRAVITRAVHALRRYFHREWDWEFLIGMENTYDTPVFVRSHLTMFYISEFSAFAGSALGSYLGSAGYIQSTFASLGLLASAICFYLIAPWREGKRLWFFIIASFCGGAALAPVLTNFLSIDTGLIVASLLATSLGFGTFAVLSDCTYKFDLILLYTGALLLCILIVPVCLYLGSIVFEGDTFHRIPQVCSIILCFLSYVVVYSQEVIFEARGQDTGYMSHTIRLIPAIPSIIFHVIKLVMERRRRRKHLKRIQKILNKLIEAHRRMDSDQTTTSFR